MHSLGEHVTQLRGGFTGGCGWWRTQCIVCFAWGYWNEVISGVRHTLTGGGRAAWTSLFVCLIFLSPNKECLPLLAISAGRIVSSVFSMTLDRCTCPYLIPWKCFSSAYQPFAAAGCFCLSPVSIRSYIIPNVRLFPDCSLNICWVRTHTLPFQLPTCDLIVIPASLHPGNIGL